VGAFAIAGFLVYFLVFLCKRRHQDKVNAERVRQISERATNTRPETHRRRWRGSELFLTQTTRRDAPEPIPDLPVSPMSPPPYSRSEMTSSQTALTSQETHQISPQTGYRHVPDDDTDSAYTRRTRRSSSSVSPPSTSYRAYRTPTLSNAHELGDIDPVAAVEYNQLPSHYSIYGSVNGAASPVPPPKLIPPRVMTPAQELAAARLRSNMSPMGLKGLDG